MTRQAELTHYTLFSFGSSVGSVSGNISVTITGIYDNEESFGRRSVFLNNLNNQIAQLNSALYIEVTYPQPYPEVPPSISVILSPL